MPKTPHTDVPAPRLRKYVVARSDPNYTDIIAKANFVRNLRNRHIARLEHILQCATYAQIYYEHVESPVGWQHSSLIRSTFKQMRDLAVYLANIGLKVVLRGDSIQVRADGLIKYVVSLDFSWGLNEVSFRQLLGFYQGQIRALFGRLLTEGMARQLSELGKEQNDGLVGEKQRERKDSLASVQSRSVRIAKIQGQVNAIIQRRQRQHQETPHSRYNRKYSDNNIKGNLLSISKANPHPDTVSERGRSKPLVSRARINTQWPKEDRIEIETDQQASYFNYHAGTKNRQSEYYQEFANVLQDEKPPGPAWDQAQDHTRPTLTPEKTQIAASLPAEVLRARALDAILSSRRIIEKMKKSPLAL